MEKGTNGLDMVERKKRREKEEEEEEEGRRAIGSSVALFFFGSLSRSGSAGTIQPSSSS